MGDINFKPNGLSENSYFPGQHEDERILFVVKPSFGVRVYVIGYHILLALGAFLLIKFILENNTKISSSNTLQISGGAALFTFLFFFGYKINKLFFWRAYITDRRIIRYSTLIPGIENKRTLLWNDVTKVKSISQGFLLRIKKIGKLKIMSNVRMDDCISLSYVTYFEDLANYCEKVIHIYRKSHEQMNTIKPFIAAPKWQRYPVDQQQVANYQRKGSFGTIE